MINIPANIFWPGFIIALLGLSLTLSFSGLYFAQSDGGPQVVPDYYEKSVDYDDDYTARQQAIELGWAVDIELQQEQGVLAIADDDGTPVDGATGQVTFQRPDIAEPIQSVELQQADEPGEYHFDDATDRAGHWDLVIEVTRGDDTYVDSIRTTVDS